MAYSPSTPSPGAAFAVGSFPGAISEDSVFPRPPPPTPKGHMPLPAIADAALTALFDRMVLSPPVPVLRLGAPSRLTIRSSATPLVSLDSPDLASLRAAGDVGYFHLVGHGIPSQLPSSALAELSRVDASAMRASILSTLGFSAEAEGVDAGVEPVMVFDVWSNGKLKKVRGMVRPTPAPGSDSEEGGEPARLSITVLITLPLDSVVSPLLPLSGAGEEGGDVEKEEKEVSEDGDENVGSFRPFSLESYAWGLYHDQLESKDPLAPYRI
uniref:Non-haem dioxygenase N-terminal domain-containing protein n=1 Tax=Aegilops tauschii TaxID=37682 RepID=M8BV84_AEGTA